MNQIKSDLCNNNRFHVVFKGKPFDFTSDSIPESAPFKAGFVILTAWNPNQENLTQQENDNRNLELFKDLLNTDLEFDEALGYCDSPSTESYCVYGMSLEEAIYLGQKHRQSAVFYSGPHGVGFFAISKTKPIMSISAA